MTQSMIFKGSLVTPVGNSKRDQVRFNHKTVAVGARLVRFTLFAIVALHYYTSDAVAQSQPRAEPIVTTSARATVETLHSALMASMKLGALAGFNARVQLLAPVLQGTFNLRGMTKVIAGNAWRRFTASDRERLIATFTRMTIATYAHNFSGFDDEQFVIVDEQPSVHGTMLVLTDIITTKGDKVRLTYLLRNQQSGWRIVDVFAEGTLSQLAAKRAEYVVVLRDRGLESLIHQIERQISRMALKG